MDRVYGSRDTRSVCVTLGVPVVLLLGTGIQLNTDRGPCRAQDLALVIENAPGILLGGCY